MSFLDTLKAMTPAGKAKQGDEDLPQMQAEGGPEASEPERRRRFPDGKKPEDAKPSQFTETTGLPSVNRRQKGNKLVTGLALTAIAGVVVAMVVTGNSKPSGEVKKAPLPQELVSNTLPKIDMPPPPVVTEASAPSAASVLADMRPEQPVNLSNTLNAPATRAGQGSMVALDQPSWRDRKKAGNLLISDTGTAGAAAAPVIDPSGMSAQPGRAMPVRASLSDEGEAGASGGGGGGRFGTQLEPTVTKAVTAALLPNRNFLITKGTMLDCVLDTALDSSVPGMTVCHLTRDIYSTDGRVLLLERGSKLVGEYGSDVKQGSTRIYVLWTRAETPNGVVVSLNSPGTDTLGRSGLGGQVDNHFGAKFGAAILLSLVEDAVAAVARTGGAGTNNYYGNTAQAGSKVVEKMLDSTINMAPTLTKNQGDHIQVMVARDLDFSTVYDLQEATR